MLNGIPKIISPDLLLILARMGHGDEIVLADANFPGERLNKNLIRCDGSEIPELMEAILQLFPLDKSVNSPWFMMEPTDLTNYDDNLEKNYAGVLRQFFPDFIFFDHQSLEGVADEIAWDKVALISLNFKKYSRWDGRQPLTEEKCKKIKSIIDKAHSLGKPFRFWGIPDTPMSWETFYAMGLDFINTDDPVGLSIFMDKISKR